MLAEGEKQKLLDSTLVIFTTDIGYFHGERGLADPRFRTSDAFTHNLDLARALQHADPLARNAGALCRMEKRRGEKNGARYRVRTCDPLRVKQVLYR